MTDKPEISIVIVSWNTRDLLRACLKSIYATMDEIAFEVIVVDNASEDGSAEMVESEFPEATLIRSESNLGFAAGCNLGLRKATGRFLMILNSDAELTAGAVSRMLDFMERRPDAGLVGPKLVSPDGTLQINGQRFPTLAREILGVIRAQKLIPGVATLGWGREDFDRDAEVDSLAGACMLVRREVVEQVGLLDERFFMYFEDVDWCRRTKRAGWKIYYLGEAQIVHGWACSSAKQGIVRSHELLHRSRYLYFRKHHGLIQAAAIGIISRLVQIAFAFKYRNYSS